MPAPLVVAAAAGTIIDVVGQVHDVINSKDPLFVRVRNELDKKIFIVEYVGGLRVGSDLQYVSSNYISPKSVSDIAMNVSSWANAFVSIELRGKSKKNEEIRVQLDYEWITQVTADITIKVHKEGASPTGDEISSSHKENGNSKVLRHSKWDEFDVIAFTTGKFIEMTILEKGIM